MSRPSIYSEVTADALLERLATGESLAAVCRDDAMPGLRTVMRWAVENESFGTEYARAREAQAEFMDDLILTTAEKAGEDPQAARVKVDAYKWRAAKLAPKRYGDKIDVTSGGEPVALDETAAAVRGAAMIAMVQSALARDESE